MAENRIDRRMLGNRIADMRLSRGISQIRLAELTGLSRVYIGYLEQGKRFGSILTYLEIVSVLGYSLNDLVCPEDPSDFVPDLVAEFRWTLGECSADEQESVVRIFREMMRMIRMIRKEDPGSV